ncbi:MAG TPA: hypothetical protein VI363_10540, partial [Burkholderiales bacterium]
MYETSRGRIPFRLSLISAVVGSALIAAYSVSDAKDSKDSKTPMTVRGVVAGSLFLPPAGGMPSSTVASYYMGAKVCVDSNNNAVCDSGEASTTTDKRGEFHLESPVSGPLVAEVLTTSTNSVVLRERGEEDRRGDDSDQDGKGRGPSAPRTVVFRASLDQIEEGATDSHSGEGKALNAH